MMECINHAWTGILVPRRYPSRFAFSFLFFLFSLAFSFFFLFPLFSCVLCVDRNVAWIVWNMNQTRGV